MYTYYIYIYIHKHVYIYICIYIYIYIYTHSLPDAMLICYCLIPSCCFPSERALEDNLRIPSMSLHPLELQFPRQNHGTRQGYGIDFWDSYAKRQITRSGIRQTGRHSTIRCVCVYIYIYICTYSYVYMCCCCCLGRRSTSATMLPDVAGAGGSPRNP